VAYRRSGRRKIRSSFGVRQPGGCGEGRKGDSRRGSREDRRQEDAEALAIAIRESISIGDFVAHLLSLSSVDGIADRRGDLLVLLAGAHTAQASTRVVIDVRPTALDL